MRAPSHPARHWRALPDGRLACEVCPRRCRLREGQRGYCFVRAAEGGGIVLTTYGRSSGLCVDPIEKKPLAHFLPGTAVLSLGTAGCNLGCRHCQNWSISRARRMDALTEEAPPRSVASAAVALGCASVAFTYNEPVVFLEYAIDAAEACRAQGVRTVAVTAGWVLPAPRAELFRAMDAANVDLKAFRERFYRRLCGASLAPVLDTLRHVRHETRCWLEITTLLIPGENDSPAEVGELARWVAGELGPEVPLHLSAFHPAGRMRDRPPTPAETLRRARAVAMEAGLAHVYLGNLPGEREGTSTRCRACGATLVERDGYAITGWRLDDAGRCRACGAPLAGVFAGPPGRWGSRRLPVRLDAAPGGSP